MPLLEEKAKTTDRAPAANVRAAHIALSRLAFGPLGDQAHQLAKQSDWLAGWLEEQLAAPAGDEDHVRQALAQARLQIEYQAGKNDDNESYEALNEQRPLTSLDKPLKDLWHLTKWNKAMAYQERVRPALELRAATWVRARSSTFQVREVLVDFWHNHFHVNAGGDDIRVNVALPHYDREVIRKHCMGNFREFLEAVASSPAMLAYLNNASSKASPANENFARELFELHTLGRERYLNHLYNRWRDVPGASAGTPEGYIDQDVYEAARAFTGWTIQDGSWHGMGNGDHLPSNGEFLYFDAWHDIYQKRVLATEFDPNQAPMADGRKVLDLVAAHPGTAVHLCTKLCRRLLSDDPPPSLIDKAVKVWTQQSQAKDQIAQVVKVIALSSEFALAQPTKAKRPFELALSFIRAIEADVRIDHQLFWCTSTMGHTLFDWPAPTGNPDVSSAWLSASMLTARWNMPLMLMADWFRGTHVRLSRQVPLQAVSANDIAAFWSMRMLGMLPDDATLSLLHKLLQGAATDDQPHEKIAQAANEPLAISEAELVGRMQHCVAALAMHPLFQAR